MINFRQKEYSLTREELKNIGYGVRNGAFLGGLGGFMVGGPFIDKSLMIPAVTTVGGALIGGGMGGYSAYRDIKMQAKKQAQYHKDSLNISDIERNINEPKTYQELIKKYPKIKEIDVFQKNIKQFLKASQCLDDYRVILDYGDIVCELDNSEHMYYSTAQLRYKTNQNYWIACINELCYNIKDNSWYLVSTYNKKQEKITISEYKKRILNDIDYCVKEWLSENNTTKLPKELEQTIKFIKQTLK